MNVIVLVGLPGSGKSTICTKNFPNYARINQDILGSRDACLAEASKVMDAGKSVIIDRCNFDKAQRAYWVNLALNYGAQNVTAIYLDVDPEECISRITDRKNHPTITEDMSLEQKRQIVYKFYKLLEIPEIAEGFSSVLITRN